MNKFLKYLLCVLFSILAINFLVSLTSFLKNTDSYLESASINSNPKAEDVITTGQTLEKQLDKTINELKNKNGEDYPALGIIYYKAVAHYSSVTVVQNFIFTLIAGFALGSMIFFIFISGLKTYKLFFAILLILIITSLLLTISDVYTSIANSEEINFNLSQFFWNMEVSAITFLVVIVILIAINRFYKTYYEIRYS